MIDDDELLAKLNRWDSALDAHWSTWRKDAKVWFDMVAGEQWDKDDCDKLKDEGRVPVTLNRTGPIIDAVCGAEIIGRQEVQYLPREVGDTGVNDVLTRGAEWFRDLCDAEFEESDAFRDAFICGLGWTETRMDYEEEAEGQARVDRVDPLEMVADPAARKPNLMDARYLRRSKVMSQDEFDSRWPNALGAGDAGEKTGGRNIDRRHRYEDTEGSDDALGDDEVLVKEYQYYDLVTSHMVQGPAGEIAEVDHEQFETLQQAADADGIELRSVTRRKRMYRRAYRSGEELLEDEPLPDGEFTLKSITGKRDRNKGTWYGLVRAMVDPQRFANKFFSQILHIINTNAKGGILAEADAFEDIKQAEESWAKADAITWMAVDGAGRIQPKPVGAYPQGLDRLMEVSISSIRDATGVNQELLGMVERDQPGILEHQRKQAAYGILAAFFDSFRRYRRLQGRLMLKYIQKYIPEGTLIRIVGDDGTARYVPLAKQPDSAKFDVMVDEAPAGPNQKAVVWGMLMQLPPQILQGLSPEMWGEFIRYSPLPDALAQKVAQAAQAAAQPDPAAQELQQRAAFAKVGKDEASARKDDAAAVVDQVKARTEAAMSPAIAL